MNEIKKKTTLEKNIFAHRHDNWNRNIRLWQTLISGLIIIVFLYVAKGCHLIIGNATATLNTVYMLLLVLLVGILGIGEILTNGFLLR